MRSSYRRRSHVPCRGALFYGGRTRHYPAARGSGSGKRSTSDSLRNLFVPRLQSGKRKSKNRWFLAAFLHPFAAEGKRMSRRSAKYSRRRQTCRTRVQPAIEERKTGRRDASPCGVRDRSREKRPAPGARNTFLHLTTKAQKIATQGQLFPPRVIAFRQAASKCALTGCLLSAFVCAILGNDSTNREWRDRFL